MTTPVQTAGPADPTAGLRAKVYAGIGAITGIVGFLQTLHIVTDAQAASVGAVGSNVSALITSVGMMFVAFKTNKQVKNGTFDAPPPPPELPPPPPAMTAVEQVKAVQEGFTDFTKAIADGVQLIQGVAATVPGLSPSVIPGSLVDQFLHGTS